MKFSIGLLIAGFAISWPGRVLAHHSFDAEYAKAIHHPDPGALRADVGVDGIHLQREQHKRLAHRRPGEGARLVAAMTMPS
jgi:hypothetical protein